MSPQVLSTNEPNHARLACRMMGDAPPLSPCYDFNTFLHSSANRQQTENTFSLSLSLSPLPPCYAFYTFLHGSVNLQQTENTFPLSFFLSLSLSPLSPCYAFHTFLHWSVNQHQAEYTGAGRPDFCHGSLQKLKARKNYLRIHNFCTHKCARIA